MPANEETLGESPDQAVSQTRHNLLQKITENSSNSVRSSSDDEEDCQKDRLGSVPAEDSEECYYKSLPVRQFHEKFIREFVDLLLEDAVFEVIWVSLPKGTDFNSAH